jgi:two-component system, NarL family, nitrate/nitrite response regulator NarL
MSKAMTKYRILIIDDHALFRESVSRLIAAEPDCDVVAHCASIDEALAILSATPIDLALLDFDLGSEKGTEFVNRARDVGFRGKVLVVTAGISEAEAADLIRQGVSGIFMKHSSAATLSQSIRQVMDGKVWFEQRYLSTAFEKVPEGKVTSRERKVLQFILEGLSNKEIGARLDISESAVKASLQQLFHKTGVRTRSQLVRVALDRSRNLL